jgi:hypothetical protein
MQRAVAVLVNVLVVLYMTGRSKMNEKYTDMTLVPKEKMGEGTSNFNQIGCLL